MCGIAGIFNLYQSAPIQPDCLKSINRRQAHRGPDDEGYYFDPFIGLAHRRLSIIDLSGGHQPLFNEDGSVAVVFNGEIYNFQPLVAELKQLGHTFSTYSDTEVIVHAWEEWGEKSVSRFRGMFAFAVWDSNRRQLFIARDRLGKKPLFYSQTSQGQLVFASELKVLLDHPDVSQQLRPEMAEDFFMYGYIPDPYTAYQNIYKLEAGHTMLLTPGEKLRTSPYWDLSAPEQFLSWEQTQSSLIERLEEAVKIRLMADVPLGAFLSGGVDSSAIVSLMARLQQQPVNTCAIGFHEQAFDESEYAQQIAQQYQTNHVSKIVDADDISLIKHLNDIYDEPYADSSALPTYRVCQLARQSVKVALSGDGGDEIFAGYRRHRMHIAEQKIRQVIPSRFRKPIFGSLGRFYPKADWAPRPLRAKTTFQSLALSQVEAYASSISKLRIDERALLFSDQYKTQLNGYNGIDQLTQHANNAPTDDPLKLIQYLDIKTWLVGDILTKVDRASMANSLEVRAPLLDHEFIEWAYSVRSQDNIQGMQGKYAFKKALEPYVNQDILYRPKMGFSMPISSWFRTSLKQTLHDAVLSPNMLDSGFFNVAHLKQMLHEHVEGYRDHGASLWCLLMFSQFMLKQ
ncbi:asparagine synthetase B [Photobacterium jeanii]|uniref:asparagine synthase (glutamine-hydrolyzing) n=1 Tax=Photobacterium jeanii TaxID=858640 RepID=A0A178K2N2_9GAMM|nr:XrtA/PEP-CTERM system amidotransferase [Photobacterium jeanii]OAN11366.1 asparagine synthetase B [Photobacterium jeanii]PST90886.1 amidotransferase 1, exosortase A system-associated [Photobacterium jeanii]